jgi:hypothetical protein
MAVFPDDFDRVYPLLRQLAPHRPAAGWRPIFDYPWRRPESPVGYAIHDGRDVVGFVGLILSEMTINGRVERFGNITTWVVRDSHRGLGALLVLPLCRLSDVTITNLTSNDLAASVFSRLGFEVLDRWWTILPPRIGLLAPRATSDCEILTDPVEIAPRLAAAEAGILQDHVAYAHHLLAVTSIGDCYAVYTIRSRWRMRAARFHYVSNPTTFGRSWRSIQKRLLRRHGALLGEADSRLLAGVSIPGSFLRPMPSPRLYRSSRLRPEQVPDLYGEVILLNVG